MATAGWRVIAALLTLLALAGCSSDHSAAPAPTPPQTADGFPLSIPHRYGNTVVPWRPDRVVTLGWNDQDIAQALGTRPVGIRSTLPEYPTYPWVRPEVANPPIVSGTDLDFDAIAAAKPHLILATGADIDRPTYDRLAKIAPTVVSENRLDRSETPWYTQLFTIGRALGKSDQARERSEEVGTRYNQIRRGHQHWVNRTAVVDWMADGQGTFLVGFRDPRRAVLDGLGFLSQKYSGPVPDDELKTKADEDLLVVVGATEEQAKSLGALANLRNVIEGRAIYIPANSPVVSAMRLGGPFARIYALEQLTPQLEAALKPTPPR
ncbi:ABC transporter substrate-binding protein [Mycobacteroides sp. LB1]|uniref:ABC transporter substrate-binding protein n=1 Tax=Mycobacteroides sp. LB1 TaxID=2750814 RepID=UPI0015DF94FB|nr:ABC transporter substrate-binding protein [Mycobacteroides sp. LB1]